MHHFFVEASQISKGQIIISGTDVNHIKNVLRMKVGEIIWVNDGRNLEYVCEIHAIQEESIVTTICSVAKSSKELPSKIYLFQGLPKSDKMDLIIQKAVELGVYSINPMRTERTIVKLDEKKEEVKHNRWMGISESAAKQSGRNIVPNIEPVMSFQEAIKFSKDFEYKWIPYEIMRGMRNTQDVLHSVTKNSSIAIFIGPEGGFTKEEILYAEEHGLIPISLGNRILRTETAGLALLSALMLHLEMLHATYEGAE